MSRGPGKDILSACPFCGGWAQVDHDPNEYSNRDKPASGFFVECGICSASTAVYRLPSGAVAAWNRRAAPFSASAIRRLDSVRTSVCFRRDKSASTREPTGDPIDVPVQCRAPDRPLIGQLSAESVARRAFRAEPRGQCGSGPETP